eukprot:4929349-Amphidinium_carterae.1
MIEERKKRVKEQKLELEKLKRPQSKHAPQPQDEEAWEQKEHCGSTPRNSGTLCLHTYNGGSKTL